MANVLPLFSYGSLIYFIYLFYAFAPPGEDLVMTSALLTQQWRFSPFPTSSSPVLRKKGAARRVHVHHLSPGIHLIITYSMRANGIVEDRG